MTTTNIQVGDSIRTSEGVTGCVESVDEHGGAGIRAAFHRPNPGMYRNRRSTYSVFLPYGTFIRTD